MKLQLTLPIKIKVEGTGVLHLPGTPEWVAIQEERRKRKEQIEKDKS